MRFSGTTVSFAQFYSIGPMYSNLFFDPLSVEGFSINPLYGPSDYNFQWFGTGFSWPFLSMDIVSLNMRGYPFFSIFNNIGFHNFWPPLSVPYADIAGTGSDTQSIFVNGIYNPITINNNPLSFNPLSSSTGLLYTKPSCLSGDYTPIMGIDKPYLFPGTMQLWSSSPVLTQEINSQKPEFVSAGTFSEYNVDDDDEDDSLPPDDGQSDTPYIAAQEGGSEMKVDAPCRIEPKEEADGTLIYGAIPIQISIYDSDQLSCPGVGVSSISTLFR